MSQAIDFSTVTDDQIREWQKAEDLLHAYWLWRDEQETRIVEVFDPIWKKFVQRPMSREQHRIERKRDWLRMVRETAECHNCGVTGATTQVVFLPVTPEYRKLKLMASMSRETARGFMSGSIPVCMNCRFAIEKKQIDPMTVRRGNLDDFPPMPN